MIKSFGNRDTQSLYSGRCPRRWQAFRGQAERKLAQLDAAEAYSRQWIIFSVVLHLVARCERCWPGNTGSLIARAFKGSSGGFYGTQRRLLENAIEPVRPLIIIAIQTGLRIFREALTLTCEKCGLEVLKAPLIGLAVVLISWGSRPIACVMHGRAGWN
jgi:hypothetical protein